MKAWRHLLLSGMTLLPVSDTRVSTSEKSDLSGNNITKQTIPAADQKTVYVGANEHSLPHANKANKARLHEFLTLLKRMPNLTIRTLPDTLDARSAFYPEDPAIGLPGARFDAPQSTLEVGASQHGPSSGLLDVLKKDGFAISQTLGFDVDGGDILYDTKRGIFLIGGVGVEAQARADAFHCATGHYAIPITMTQPYANYGVPTPGGLVESPVKFYHLDTFANILPNGELMIYSGATTAADTNRLKKIYGPQLLSINTEDAERYITNFVTSRDTKGKAHVLLPAVSQQLPFADHVTLRKQLQDRGYTVHGPEDAGHSEPSLYTLNLFDQKSPFVPQLHQFLSDVLSCSLPMDIVALKHMAERYQLELGQDKTIAVLRGGAGQVYALPLFDSDATKVREDICVLQEILAQNLALRNGKLTKEDLVRTLYPNAPTSATEIMAAFDELPYDSYPDKKLMTAPYIFSGGGPECMTLEVLNEPSPQQKIWEVVAKEMGPEQKLQAHTIAGKAGFKLRFEKASYTIEYPDGSTQHWEQGAAFTDNILQAARAASISK